MTGEEKGRGGGGRRQPNEIAEEEEEGMRGGRREMEEAATDGGREGASAVGRSSLRSRSSQPPSSILPFSAKWFLGGREEGGGEAGANPHIHRVCRNTTTWSVNKTF